MKLKCALIILSFLVLCARTFAIEISVSEITADPGEKVTASISVDNAKDIAGCDITLEYDSVMLTAKDARATDLVKNLNPVTNINIAGKVRFAMAAIPGLKSGSGAIFDIDFEIKPTAKGKIVLTLLDASLFDENGMDLPVTIRNGSITIREEQPIPPKTLTLKAVNGKVGEIILSGVEVDDTTAISGGDITIVYDSAILSIEDIKQTDLMAGVSAVINKDIEGKIRIVWASAKGLGAGKGAMFEITFKANKAGDSKLDFDSVSLFDEKGNDIVTKTVNGKITVEEAPPIGPPVIREAKGKMLALQATYNAENTHGHTYIDIWKGEFSIKSGQFLEFQVTMFSGNPTFKGSVDLVTTDGTTLRDSGAKDQNGLSAHPATDISQYARDNWYHRKISLDQLAGKTLKGVMIATDSNEHRQGLFRIYVDNIQITDGSYIINEIYLDEETIPITGKAISTDTTFAGTQGMSNYSVTIVGETPVTPAGKLATSWGKIKIES